MDLVKALAYWRGDDIEEANEQEEENLGEVACDFFMAET